MARRKQDKEDTEVINAPSAEKLYKVVVLGISLNSNRVGKLGEVFPASAFVVRNVEELVKGGYIKEVE